MAYETEPLRSPYWRDQDIKDGDLPTNGNDGRRPLFQWSLACPSAVFVVTPDLRLLDANLAGDVQLGAGGDLRVVSGHLGFAEKPRTSALQAFVENLDELPAGWVYRRPCGAFVMIRAEPIRAETASPDDVLIALTVYPTDVNERYVWADFAPHFGLTRSETTVVKRLVGGQPPFDVAEDLGVSIETVRTHIRRIYNKLGITSREQLFSMMAPFRLG